MTGFVSERLSKFDSSRWFGQSVEKEERLGARRTMVLNRLEEHRMLMQVTGGPIYKDVTHLPLIGGGMLGPAKGGDGRVLKWGMWFPHHRALLDVFKREMPSDREMKARKDFAESNGLSYAVVEPNRRMNLDELSQWLKEPKEDIRNG